MSAPHPFQRLLLATEHTDFDSGAEALALALAQRCGLPLAVVLPMLSNPEFEMLAPALAQKADAQVAAHIQALHAAAQPLGVELQPRVRRGSDLADEIVDEARRAQADLLVIRRRGQRSFLSRLLVGEMVSRVVARSPCSVLVAPRAAVMWRTGVMVGVHPQAPDAAVVAAAASVAAACQVPLRLACVAESDGDQPLARAAIDSLMQLARRVHADVQGEVLAGHAAPALLSAASQRGTDLLVVSRERPGQRPAAGGRARLGSTAQAVTGQAGGPVLVHVASGST